MNNKYKLILVALIGVLFYSYPSSLALFANDHAFYNGSAPCTKCHTDIQVQLEDTGRVTSLHRNQDNQSGCVSCHSTNTSAGRVAGETYHSAYSPACNECHVESLSVIMPEEAHTVVVTGAHSSTMMVEVNEACMLCHTTLYDSVMVRNRQVFAFENDSITANGSEVYNGSYTTTFLNPEPKGDHNFVSTVQCIACHMPIYEIMGQSQSPYPAHRQFGCDGCHRGSGMVVGQTNESQVTYHAAKTKYCSDCHGQVNYPRDCNQCHVSHGGFKPGVR